MVDPFFSGQYHDAIVLLEEKINATEDHEQKLRYTTWKARAEAKKNLKIGLEHLKKIQEDHPELDEPYSAIASTYSDLGFLDKAHAVLDDGILKATDKVWLRLGKASYMIREGNVAGALNILEDLMEASPNFASGYTRAAEVLTEQGKPDDAKRMYERG